MEKEQLIVLVKKSQSGDAEAIEKLLQYAHTSVSYQCRKMLNNEQDAEDMTQEVLVTIYTKLDTLQEPAAFWKWANQITATRCINALNRTHVEYQFAEDEEGHSILDNLEELDEQSIPDKAIDNAETARMIEEIVEGLPDAQRAATLMFYYNEMSVKEIAKTMQVSENTVKSRLNYARKAIKEKVLDYEKQGVKLYGLSPLPFLLYFLRLAANLQKDEQAAGIVVAEVMAAESAAVGVAAGAGGAAATAGAGTAATTATVASTGSTAAAGIFASLSTKVVAGILAAVVTIGSIVAVVIPNTLNDTTEPTAMPTEVVSATESGNQGTGPETEVPTVSAETETATEPEASESTTVPTEHVHSYDSVVTEPTCTAGGYTTYTCSCGNSYQGDETAATGHSMAETERVNYTCDTPGYYTMTCSFCGHSETTEIPIHSNYVMVCNPDYENDGHRYNKVWSCQYCEYLVIEEGELQPHNNEVVLNCPCGPTAYIDYKCKDCGVTSRVHVDPTYPEHNYVKVEGLENGYRKCTQCGLTAYSDDWLE